LRFTYNVNNIYFATAITSVNCFFFYLNSLCINTFYPRITVMTKKKTKNFQTIFVTLIKHLGQRNESKEIKIREQGLDK